VSPGDTEDHGGDHDAGGISDGAPPPEEPPPPPPPSLSPPIAGPPSLPAADRLQAAWQRRPDTDYIFNYWTALGWTVLTFGIYSLYVIYQLVRRMRDHNVRRIEFLDAALTFGWEEANRRRLEEELTPSFQRANGHLDELRRMTGDFREPVVWVVLAIIARGIVDIVAFVLLDQDLVRHERAEAGIETELRDIFERFGAPLPVPPPLSPRAKNNYVGRIIATVVSLGFYLFWWFYNQMNDPNVHFESNWPEEDAVVAAVLALR